MILVTDIETDGLYRYKTKEAPSVIHCAVAIELETGKEHQFVGDYGGYIDLLERADHIVGHNFIAYDRKVISDLLGYKIPLKKIRDTYVLAMLYEPKRKDGHSLAAWGSYFGQEKPKHDDWTKFSHQMLHRCTEDTRINVRLYKKLQSEMQTLGFSDACVMVEMAMAEILRQQQENGCPLDTEFARKIYYECKDRADSLEEKISGVFPALPDSRKTNLFLFKPKFTQKGSLYSSNERKLREYKIDNDLWPSLTDEAFDEDEMYPAGSMTLFNWRDFDIDALDFVKQHLLRLGWEPLVYTDKGSPKVTEESLEHFDVPEAKLLKRYMLLRNRERVFLRWLEEVSDEGYVHSRMKSIGAWTHRSSHTNFMGNPPRIVTEKISDPEELRSNAEFITHYVEETPSGSEHFVPCTQDEAQRLLADKGKAEFLLKGWKGGYGYECRRVWTAPGDTVFVGADASGIQMRAFAHYIGDEEYAHQVVTGDIHSYNQELAGLRTRNISKTFIYAYLLGCGDHKAGVIYQMTPEEMSATIDEVMSSDHDSDRHYLNYGLDYLNIPKTPHNYALAYRGKKTKWRFEDAIPGLRAFKENAKKEIQRGPIWWTALDGRKIKIFSAHLKLAAALQSFEAAVMKRATLTFNTDLTRRGIWYKQCNYVHDEWLTLSKPGAAEDIGHTKVEAIKQAGLAYNSMVPLDGEFKIGKDWFSVH